MKSIDKYVLVLVASLALLLAGCGGGSTVKKGDPAPTPVETAQAALKTAQDGLAAADTDETMLAGYQAVQKAADDLVAALRAGGGSAADIEKAIRTSENAKVEAGKLSKKIADAAKKAADDATAAAIARTMKLWPGIGDDPLANNGTGTLIRTNGALTVQRGANPAVALDIDDDMTVAALNGWEGSVHTGTDAAKGTYTAHVYANKEAAGEGKKFGKVGGGDDYEYNLATGGSLSIDTSTAGYPAKISSDSFDQSAGAKSFELPDNQVAVKIPGSFHGVAGTYSCAPGSNETCTSTVASKGFTFSGGTWTFKPDDAETRVSGTGMEDTVYAVYGWWLYESADGAATVSAFADERGTVSPATGLTALNGKATYKGGAAGKYAISAGAHNDAGHFTADAMLEANFTDNTVTGTLDNFMGVDGMARDWSVALGKSHLDNDGAITGITQDGSVVSGNQMTTWTMGETASDAAGEWSALLMDNGDDGVPKVGAGTFFAEYGNTGRMVGAFGVNKQ